MTTMDLNDKLVTASFLDYGYWIKFKEPTSTKLWIGENKPGSGGMITGLGHKLGDIQNLIIVA